MVLFRPFRRASDLLSGFSTLKESYEHWWAGEAHPEAHQFVTNHLDYYASRELTKTKSHPDAVRYESYEGIVRGEDDDELCDDKADIPSDLDEDLDQMELVIPASQRFKHIDMLQKTTEVTQLSARSTMNTSPTPNTPIEMAIQQVEVLMRTCAEPSNSTSSIQPSITASEYPDVDTRVQILAEACRSTDVVTAPHNDQISSSGPEGVHANPSLIQISWALNLNDKQHKMFAVAGENFLTSLLTPTRKTSQFVGFLGGLPGAGKSRVIMAFQVLASKWGATRAIETAAYQGVAAQAANGQTIHKLFGWRVNSRTAWAPTREQKERFAQLKLLILDEISTCDVKILGMVDSSLQKLTGRTGEVFGGVHVLLVGDWLQQLPVAGQPAFLPVKPISAPKKKQTEREKKEADAYLLRVRGGLAYEAVNYVVILTENMRHRADPTWRAILDKWRIGRYDQEDITLVNQIAYEENWRSRTNDHSSYCRIIVTSNTLRVEFNASTIRSFCAQANVSLHRFPATVTRTRQVLTGGQRRSLECLRDDKTKGMPMMLEIALGSVVQCTKNISVLKLSNGSIGTVVSITPSTADQVQVYTADGIEVHTHSLPPDIVFVKLKEFEAQNFLPGLPSGVVPVTTRIESGVRIDMAARSFSITITQVPLVPAYSLTTETCQGLTVEKMILAPLKHPTRYAPQKSSFYVGVTRVKSLRQLYLMAPLTSSFLSYFTPREDALAESSRLQSVERSQTRGGNSA